MLHGYTIIPVTHEQAVITVAESLDAVSSMDAGSATTTLAEHPVFGDIVVFENAAGQSIIVAHRDHAKKFSS